MKAEYLLDFIKDEEKEEFKRKQMIESKSKKQFTLTEVRKQFLEIAKELTNEINRLEDLYENGEINIHMPSGEKFEIVEKTLYPTDDKVLFEIKTPESV